MKQFQSMLCLALCFALFLAPACLADGGGESEALRLLEQGDFAQAAQAFKELDAMEQSREYMLYASARQYEQDGYFEQADTLYAQIPGFLDSDAHKQALVIDDRMYEYRDALALQAQGDTEGAARIFRALGEYMDSAARLDALSEALRPGLEQAYQDASALYAAEDYQGAMQGFSDIQGYKDSLILMLDAQLKWQEQTYAQAKTWEQEGKIQEALALYEALDNYRDSAQRASEIALPAKEEYASDNWYYYCDDVSGLYGYMDAQGNMMIRPQFATVLNFSEGRAMVLSEDGESFFIIDERGELCFEANPVPKDGFETIFQQGRMPFLSEDGLLGYYDRDGHVAIAPVWADADLFCEGLAAVTNADGKMGYIDLDGRVVIEPWYDFATNFNDGRALVTDSFENCAFWVIDKQGKEVGETVWYDIAPYQNGLAAVLGEHERFGYMDVNGDLVIDCQYSDAGRFWSDLAAVQWEESGLYGLINRRGETVVEPKFQRARMCSNTLGFALKDDHYGLIDGEGNWIVPAAYDDIWALFDPELALVEKDGRCIYIDKTGREVKSWKFLSEAEPDPTPIPTPKPTPTPTPKPTHEPDILDVIDPVLKKGMNGQGVRVLQEQLVKKGFLKEKPDGYFGANTEKALKAYQKSKGEERTGTITHFDDLLWSLRNKDIDVVDRVMTYLGKVSWYDVNKSESAYRFEIQNADRFRTIDSVTLAIYWVDSNDKAHYSSRNFLNWTFNVKVKPSDIQYTDYVRLPMDMAHLYAAVYQVHYTDGRYGYVDKGDLIYSQWDWDEGC